MVFSIATGVVQKCMHANESSIDLKDGKYAVAARAAAAVLDTLCLLAMIGFAIANPSFCNFSASQRLGMVIAGTVALTALYVMNTIDDIFARFG